MTFPKSRRDEIFIETTIKKRKTPKEWYVKYSALMNMSLLTELNAYFFRFSTNISLLSELKKRLN